MYRWTICDLQTVEYNFTKFNINANNIIINYVIIYRFLIIIAAQHIKYITIWIFDVVCI